MAQLTPLQFFNRLREVLQPNVLYREVGALRAIRCSPLFKHHQPEAVLAAAKRAGWIKPQPPYPEDFYLDPDAVQKFLPSES